jgi:hypothetical protein
VNAPHKCPARVARGIARDAREYPAELLQSVLLMAAEDGDKDARLALDLVVYATPVCFACLPPPKPLPVRRKCRHCIHDEHIGMCTGRNGGTAYPCPCHHVAELI